jgi:acetyl esterase/lipase
MVTISSFLENKGYVMAKYQVDPELLILKPLKFTKYTNSRRGLANFMFNLTMFFTRPKKGIRRRRYWIRGYNHMKVKVTVYEIKDQMEKAPGLLYIHGGGFQMAGTPVHIAMLQNIILQTKQKAVYVSYHLSPKHPFPTAFFDCYHALLWMAEHADYLNIDLNHISVAGDSAGGNLATAVALYARDQKGPKIERQMLLYPVIDVRQNTPSMKAYDDTPMWNSILNKSMWELYLKNGDHGMLPYASPSCADVHDMPETYIETAQYDCLRDEAIEYARKLSEAGVTVHEYHTLKTVHGYDAVFFSKLVKRMMHHRIQFMKGEL